MLDSLDEQQSKDTQQVAHCKRLLKRIKSFSREVDDRLRCWKKARKYADGEQGDEGDEDGTVRVNLIGSMLETVQPSIYAKAPEIAVDVEERIDTSQYPIINKFAKTLENALNVFLVKEADLKKRGKSAVRGTLTSTVSYAKIIYQRDFKDDPIIRNRINDTQDNISTIEALVEETKMAGGESAEHEARLYELQQQLKSLESQVEVIASEGLVADVLRAEDLIIVDASIREVDEFAQAEAIAHRIKMTVGKFKTQFKKEPPKGSKTYIMGEDDEGNEADIDDDDKIIVVYEVWSLKDLTVYTLCEGAQEYVREPYQPQTLGAQWYPFFPLQLRRVEGKKYPKSFVELLIELQDEYNTRRTTAAEHRKKNIPVRLVNKSSGISDEEIAAINNRSLSTDVIGVTSDNPDNFDKQLASLPEIPYNTQMYDTADILFDLEKVGNTQDAASGAIRIAKTATEAEIAAAGQQGRSGEALDTIEDWLRDIAIYSAQLLLQNVPAEVIQKRFGAESVWPELDKKSLFELVNINIRAGSTAKPNKMRERDQWIQLLPEIQKAVETIITAKQGGNTELESLTINLLEETFKRFDEKLNAKSLLGLVDEEGNEVPPQQNQQMPAEVMANLQAAMQQLQAEIERLQKENEQLKQSYDLKQREVAIKERDMSLKEQIAETQKKPEEINPPQNEDDKQELILLQQSIDSNNALMQTFGEMMKQMNQQMSLISAPKKKIARAIKQPDGSFVMQSEEVM